ncbi:MAG TPA: tRNA guanosine(34) transglycosylase Tgt [Spirochaetota bacterium]|nr:tRNA guanosine(34) transglycosylase Tgt [Spirochaetota bacterium]HNT11278.1 tRNA guanosine(34) transglycosylase Tgt [Spirochaetota bacterium]
MEFRVHATDTATGARTGTLSTAHGEIATPVFMPVATRGAVRALTNRDIDELGFDMILANTYHLYLRPGADALARAGGLHRFMRFDRAILTDSGGFQVFSLSNLCTVREEGVEFRSHIDGSRHLFTPRLVLDAQRAIGSDIMMVLDECIHYPATEAQARGALEKTVAWARDSHGYWRERFDTGRQALFAITQGGVYEHLRRECIERLLELDVSGYAIGGLSVGEPKELYRAMTELTLGLLPAHKPRYMMGVGSPLEILYAVSRGVDMFDCVMPTRIARNGTLYTDAGRINIKTARFADDVGPIDAGCPCYVCRTFSRAYLRHIFRAGEIAALIYNTYHNLSFMKRLMDRIAASIAGGSFGALMREYERAYAPGGGDTGGD